MTITTQTLRNDYTANGVNTSFAFTFPIFYESNATPKFSLEVITTDADGVETIKTETTDYTITYTTIENGVISQGNVVFNTAPTNGHKVSLLRKVNLTQNGDFTDKGTDDFNGATLESALDKLTLLALQQQENLNRVVRLPKSSPLTNIEFPIDATRANQVVVINNAGDNLSTKELADVGLAPVSPYMATLLDDTTASQARTTLDAQQLNANLSALAGLTGASNKIPYFTGAGAMGLTDVINPATTTTLGTIQIATNAEAQAYTDSSKAIVPSSLKSALGQFAVFEDQKASGTAGGTPTTGARNTRVLNTTITNTITGCSLASNQITLPAGTYFVRGHSMTGSVFGHRLYLRNVSDSNDALGGTNGQLHTSIQANTPSFIEGVITIASSKVFELQHYIVANGSGNSGLGYPVSDGNVERYSRILIQKIG